MMNNKGKFKFEWLFDFVVSAFKHLKLKIEKIMKIILTAANSYHDIHDFELLFPEKN